MEHDRGAVCDGTGSASPNASRQRLERVVLDEGVEAQAMSKPTTRAGRGKRTGRSATAQDLDTGPRMDGDGGKLGARRPGSMSPRQRGDGGGQRRKS
jgi:hypothetical protein